MNCKPSHLRRIFLLELTVTIGVLALSGALTTGQQLNLVLLADTNTDARQWPAIVDWAQIRIRTDRLLPENYTIR
jgi:hypothetical protein